MILAPKLTDSDTNLSILSACFLLTIGGRVVLLSQVGPGILLFPIFINFSKTPSNIL